MYLPMAIAKQNHGSENLINKYLTILSEVVGGLGRGTYLAFVNLCCPNVLRAVTRHKVKERIT